MPRPKLVSDEAVLDAANEVLIERGSASFTLSDIAVKVGLSRAALIQRFQSREVILREMAKREVVQTERYLNSLPLDASIEGLWSFLREIVGSMGAGKNFGARVLIAWMETRDPHLRVMANERYELVQKAIAIRVPPTVIAPSMLARHLHAVIAGATMQWIVSGDDDLAEYVLLRLTEALSMIFPGHRFA